MEIILYEARNTKTAKMASEKNKVLWAYVAADLLFVIMGAVMVGFTVIVQNEIKVVPTDGEQAARNLLYSRFPLTGT